MGFCYAPKISYSIYTIATEHELPKKMHTRVRIPYTRVYAYERSDFGHSQAGRAGTG